MNGKENLPMRMNSDTKPFQPPGSESRRSQGGLRSRLLALALGITLVAVVVITAVAIDSANSVSRRAQETSSESLREQAEAYLVQINNSIAEQNDLILDRAARDVQTVAASAAAIYSGNMPAGFWPPEEHVFAGPEGQFLNGPDDTSSVFVPVTQTDDQGALPAEILQDIELSAYLDLVLEPVFQNNPNAAALYMGSVNEMTRYYPNIQLGTLVPPDFQVTQRPWYTTSLTGNLEAQGLRPVWSPVYLDATGLGLVTTVAVPVYGRDNDLIGVVGLDLTLGEISANIETTRVFQSGYSFLIDHEGKAIILPEVGYADILGRAPEPDEFATDLNTSADFTAIVEHMTKGESGFETLQIGERELFVAYAPLESAGWSLGSVVASKDVLQSIAALQGDLYQTTQSLVFTRVIPAAGIIAIVLILLALLWTNRLVNPIQKLAEAAQSIGAGQWDVQIPVRSQARGSDEIDLLAHTLASMAAQLRQSFGELEQRVAERTQQLEYRSLQLQTAAEVARDITYVHDLDAMLQNAVDLISARFGFYNVGIFLVDDTREYAHLQAASGELGSRLMDQNIKLKVGQEGIIGYVTGQGKARIATDVFSDDLYLKVSILPETRSEVALPLRIGEQIIGALDVQSTREAAFDQEDVIVLQTLADQLAIAIENIRLVSQLQATLQEASLLYHEQARESWAQMETQLGPRAYEYDRLEVRPMTYPNIAWTQEAQTEAHKLVVPLMLREQVIGFIGLESADPSHRWTQDEIAIVEATANQAAITLENARLLAETRRRAAREQVIGDVTAQMRASLDVDTVLQTAIREIAEKIGIAQVEVHLGADLEGERDSNGR